MTNATRELAMFPLGSVLFPGMPLPLRIFEPRYLEMLSLVLGDPEHEFGVVLIERGSEVGGGDVRFQVGTVARIMSMEEGDGSIVVLATGVSRFEVVRWLQDDPFPLAEVRELAPLEVDDSAASELEAAEVEVRASISRASEFVDLPWRAGVELSTDPAERIWQLAGIAPLNSMDQYALLRSASASQLLVRLVEDTKGAESILVSGWGSDLEDEGNSPD